jgi:ascorbate-specific PTS system EIIC-type component UlaA
MLTEQLAKYYGKKRKDIENKKFIEEPQIIHDNIKKSI